MIPPRRRGVCPSLAAPMQTGDGLLARITPSGATIPLDAVAALCAAARRHGNGIVEITARGSIQVRGLVPLSAPAFAVEMESIAIDVADGIPVWVSPLAGLEGGEAIDAGLLAQELRAAIVAAGLKGRLAPKASVIIDAGGALNLDALPADVRLQADTGPEGAQIGVLLGGDASSATHIGTIAPNDAVEAAMRLLAVLAAHGPAMRARTTMGAEGDAPFRSAIGELSISPDYRRRDDHLPLRPRAEPIGVHTLRDGTVALGIGLAFGHTDVEALEHLVDAARATNARGLRTAPDRTLLIVGFDAAKCGRIGHDRREPRLRHPGERPATRYCRLSGRAALRLLRDADACARAVSRNCGRTDARRIAFDPSVRVREGLRPSGARGVDDRWRG